MAGGCLVNPPTSFLFARANAHTQHAALVTWFDFIFFSLFFPLPHLPPTRGGWWRGSNSRIYYTGPNTHTRAHRLINYYVLILFYIYSGYVLTPHPNEQRIGAVCLLDKTHLCCRWFRGYIVPRRQCLERTRLPPLDA